MPAKRAPSGSTPLEPVQIQALIGSIEGVQRIRDPDHAACEGDLLGSGGLGKNRTAVSNAETNWGLAPISRGPRTKPATPATAKASATP